MQEALNASMRGRTVLIIAHRLSTVEKADRVLVIHKGHVVEQGTPSDLLNLGGMFASLARHQLCGTGSSLTSFHHVLSVDTGMQERNEGEEEDGFEAEKLFSSSLDSGIDFKVQLTSAYAESEQNKV